MSSAVLVPISRLVIENRSSTSDAVEITGNNGNTMETVEVDAGETAKTTCEFGSVDSIEPKAANSRVVVYPWKEQRKPIYTGEGL